MEAGELIEPRWPFVDRVRAFTTSRSVGVSTGPYARFNLAGHVGDDPGAVAGNRRRLQALLGGRPIHWLDQVHGIDVVEASGVQTEVPTADAIWTRDPTAAIAVLTADCLPVVLLETSGAAVGIAHGGWRGLVNGVLGALLAAMPEGRYAAWIGPGIGPEAFEVGEAVFEALAGVDLDLTGLLTTGHAPGKGYLDLFTLAERQLENLGVAEVFCDRICTYASPMLYSYRRDGETGRMATVAALS
jgi:YfiH family protein